MDAERMKDMERDVLRWVKAWGRESLSPDGMRKLREALTELAQNRHLGLKVPLAEQTEEGGYELADMKEFEVRVAQVDDVTTENFDEKAKELVDRFGEDVTGVFEADCPPPKTMEKAAERNRLFEAYHAGKAVRFAPPLEEQRTDVLVGARTNITGTYLVPILAVAEETP